MQPYGKFVEVRNSCLCCGTTSASRAGAKQELRKLIEEELNTDTPENCKFCDYADYKCICYLDLNAI
jgi:hypothetical protein